MTKKFQTIYPEVPKGSTFEQECLMFARKRAIEDMDDFAEKRKWRLTTEEAIELKNYGRP